MWIYLNDRIVHEEQARISVFDRGFLYGEGVFETVRIYDGHPAWLERHLARLTRSCQQIHLAVPSPEKNWAEVFQEVIDKNQLDHAAIRLTLSRGQGPATPDACADPTIVLFPRSLPLVTPSQRHNGVRIAVTTIRKPSPLSYPTQAKTLNYVNNLLAKREASAQGAFEGLLLTLGGHLAECSMSNIFFIKNTTLHTPSPACGILPGITRGIVLEAAPALGLQPQEGRYTPEFLYEADECFLTSSGIGILPVEKIDGRPFPKRSAHSWVDTLQTRYDCLLREQSR